MRASEVIRARVIDADGADLGKVEDVRVVQDGPYIEGFGAALRIDGLIVGKATLAARLGYDRSQVRGPALLKALFGALERRAHYVRWEDVEAIEDRRVRLRVVASDLPERPDPRPPG
jgi:sporulation protein YlmC with PRC-barrel domain